MPGEAKALYCIAGGPVFPVIRPMQRFFNTPKGGVEKTPSRRRQAPPLRVKEPYNLA